MSSHVTLPGTPCPSLKSRTPRCSARLSCGWLHGPYRSIRTWHFPLFPFHARCPRALAQEEHQQQLGGYMEQEEEEEADDDEEDEYLQEL